MAVALVDRQPRPTLRLVRGGLEERPSSATYWRRRVVALVLAVAFVVVAMAGARAVVRPLAGAAGAPPAPAEAPTVVPPGTATHVVAPGETLWDVARDLRPDGDVRSVVDELVARNGGATIRPGQVLVLPG